MAGYRVVGVLAARRALSVTAAVLASATGASAGGPEPWIGAHGNLGASVDFATSGTDLIVTLTDTSTADVLVPSDVLTAVFFNVSGAPLSLTRTSAVLPAGSVVLFGGTDPGGVVGGEWAYKSGLSGPEGTSYGISSSGLNMFGPADLFPGNNLQGPASKDGLQYGITSAGDNPATGNSAVTGDNALIKNQVVFTLGGLPPGFDPFTSVTSVAFQYGTAIGTESNFPGRPVPEPAPLALLAGAGLIFARRGRR
jgi:hypothetical protein